MPASRIRLVPVLLAVALAAYGAGWAGTAQATSGTAGGYWLVGADGHVYGYGGAPRLESPTRQGSAPALIGLAPTPSGRGYWVADTAGGVTAVGDAPDEGSAAGAQNVVAISATPSGPGYWLATADGNVLAFGAAAPTIGSLAGSPPNSPVVGLAPTPSGAGYWLVTAAGQVRAFGDAGGFGSAQSPSSPVVGMAAASGGGGYWLVTAAGDVLAFGAAEASFAFPAGGSPAHPIVAVTASPSGTGFWLADRNGKVYGFGDAAVAGDASGCQLPAGIVGLAASAAGTVSPAPVDAPNCGLDPPTPTTTATTTTTTTTTKPSAAAFDIGLIGDTGYNGGQDTTLLRVRAQMAKYNLAFVTHDGDTKPQSMPCSDARDRSVYNVLNGFSPPLIYTPGDNEWTDCSKALTRIASIRKLFFSSDVSLGTTKMPLTRQKPTYVENARWTKGGVVFATLDVPGPAGKSPSAGETSARHNANMAWLNAAFDQAEATQAPAVMIIWQDDPFNGSSDTSLVAALRSRTIKFTKPVVLVHGDSHKFILDHPWPTVANFTRLETYGDSGSNKWVKATVDPGRPGVFTFTTITS